MMIRTNPELTPKFEPYCEGECYGTGEKLMH